MIFAALQIKVQPNCSTAASVCMRKKKHKELVSNGRLGLPCQCLPAVRVLDITRRLPSQSHTASTLGSRLGLPSTWRQVVTCPHCWPKLFSAGAEHVDGSEGGTPGPLAKEAMEWGPSQLSITRYKPYFCLVRPSPFSSAPRRDSAYA